MRGGQRAGGSNTDADVRPLAAKLKGLHVLLTPGEQALWHTLLRRAAGQQGAPADTVGFAWAVIFNPFTYLDTVAADMRRPMTPEKVEGGGENSRR